MPWGLGAWEQYGLQPQDEHGVVPPTAFTDSNNFSIDSHRSTRYLALWLTYQMHREEYGMLGHNGFFKSSDTSILINH